MDTSLLIILLYIIQENRVKSFILNDEPTDSKLHSISQLNNKLLDNSGSRFEGSLFPNNRVRRDDREQRDRDPYSPTVAPKKTKDRNNTIMMELDFSMLGPGQTNLNITANRVIPYWKPKDKIFYSNRNRYFKFDLTTRSVKIKKKGNYFVYSQLTFHDNTLRYGYSIRKNDTVLTKCSAYEWGVQEEDGLDVVKLVMQCPTSVMFEGNRGDHIAIFGAYSTAILHKIKTMSHWGITRL